MPPSKSHFSFWVCLRGYQSADSSKRGFLFNSRQEAWHSCAAQVEPRPSHYEAEQRPSRDTYSGFHFWPVCWDTSWLLVHMALEVANQKADGSRICFPTHLGEKQTKPQHKKCARETQGRRQRETSSSFLAGCAHSQCDWYAQLPH